MEFLKIDQGMMTMRLLENGLVLDDIKPFQRLRLRSRKATLIDCTSFLRPGIDVCVLYQKNVSLDEEPVIFSSFNLIPNLSSRK